MRYKKNGGADAGLLFGFSGTSLPRMVERQMMNGNIAKNLHDLRVGKRMTQVDLSKKSGVSQQIISQYETGRNAIGVVNLIRLAKALECLPKDIDERFDHMNVDEVPEQPTRVRNSLRIDDDMLRYVVEAWRDLSMEDRNEVMGVVIVKRKNAKEATKVDKAKITESKTNPSKIKQRIALIMKERKKSM